MKEPSKSKPGRKSRSKKPESKTSVEPESDPGENEDEDGGESWTYWDRRKTKAMTAKYELEVAIKRNDLVPREDLRRVFARFYTVHASKLRPLGGKLGPDVAAALGVKDDALIVKAIEILDRDLLDALEEMKRILNEYLLSIDEGELTD